MTFSADCGVSGLASSGLAPGPSHIWIAERSNYQIHRVNAENGIHRRCGARACWVMGGPATRASLGIPKKENA